METTTNFSSTQIELSLRHNTVAADGTLLNGHTVTLPSTDRVLLASQPQSLGEPGELSTYQFPVDQQPSWDQEMMHMQHQHDLEALALQQKIKTAMQQIDLKLEASRQQRSLNQEVQAIQAMVGGASGSTGATFDVTSNNTNSGENETRAGLQTDTAIETNTAQEQPQDQANVQETQQATQTTLVDQESVQRIVQPVQKSNYVSKTVLAFGTLLGFAGLGALAHKQHNAKLVKTLDTTKLKLKTPGLKPDWE